MEVDAASSSDEGGHPRKRRRQHDEGDRPSKHQAQRNGIIAGDRADITLQDQFFGGHHHHHHGSHPISDSATSSSEALIKSLSFPTMNTRRDYISEECPRTCEWLLDTAEWKNWQRSFEVTDSPRLLWIKGHAGSGKSTIMKYAYGNASRHKRDKEIVLVHFFNARATEKIDKSTEGMYRTILVQLLQALQTTDIPGDVARRTLGRQADWHIERLLNLFRDILRAQVDRPVTCFVDALDECDDDQVREMIRRFRDLMEKESKGVRVKLRVLFSSRNYPAISPPPKDKVICMQLEDQPGHARDITNYIESYLQVHDSPIAQEVKVGVQEKARGSFIWCKLVIDLLNKDNDEARLDRTLYLRERLAAIPPELDALFAEILGMDGEDRVSDPETILCMQWVLFSMRELTPRELWWAIRRGVEPEANSTELAARCRPEYLERYILRASRGLVESVKDKRGWLIVQVIHESVRDFLLGQGKMGKLIGLEVCEKEAVAHSHEQIKRICRDELFVHAAHNSIPRAVLENICSNENYKLGRKLAEEMPLLLYATQQMVKHANAALLYGFEQEQFLDDLERRRERFNILRIVSNNSFADTSLKVGDANLTEILLYANAEALIARQYRRLDAVGVSTHRFGLEAGWGVGRALWHGLCNKAVEAFVDVHLRRHNLGGPRRDLLLTIVPKRPFQRNIWESGYFRDPLFDIAQTNPHLGLFFLVAALPVSREASELLAMQPQSMFVNFSALLLFVLENPLQFENFQDSLNMAEALRWAAHQGYIDMAQILLDKYHVDINSSSSDGLTPLHYAAKKTDGTMVDFLLARDGIEPDPRDDHNRTPLHYACIEASNTVRRQLAARNVDVNASSSYSGKTPRCAPASYRGEKVIEILLAAPGVDVDARDRHGETPLHIIASWGGNQPVAKMLLSTRKVDVNARTKDGRTPRDLALACQDQDMAKLLADYGGD